MPRSAPGVCAGLPSTSTSPSVGVISPAATLSRVDLPQPDGPTRQANCPSGTVSEIRSSARTSPRRVLKRMATSTSGSRSCVGLLDIRKGRAVDDGKKRVSDEPEEPGGQDGGDEPGRPEESLGGEE